jgi:phage shock protein A
VFNLIVTLLRGRAHDAERAFADQHAMPLLSQQIRDSANGIQSARRAVAVAVAQNEQEKQQHATILARIADLEARTIVALEKGSDGLAREAADAIAYLEAEMDASVKAQAQFETAIAKLKSTLRQAEARLQELQRGERLAKATQEAQRLDCASTDTGLVALDEAEETLARLRSRQQQNDAIASVLEQMDGPSRSAGIMEKLADAGFGPPLRSSADDVIARLRIRMTTTNNS